MKKITFTILGIVLVIVANAGGLVTNTNQSSQYVRTLSRNASTEIDAVYFNPAGLSKLDNGFHLSLNNQSVFQTKTISNNYSLLNKNEYVGDVKALLFPSAFAAYKMDKLTLSFGFGPVGGGGSATFNDGLPSFEMRIAGAVPAFADLAQLGKPVEAYDAKIEFDGSSMYLGFQLGATYEVNEMISVFAGARYVSATNVYTGGISDIMLGSVGALENGSDYVLGAAGVAQAYADNFNTASGAMSQLVAGGAGAATLAYAQSLGYLTSDQVAAFTQGLMGLGVSADQIAALPISQAQTIFAAGATEMEGTVIKLGIGAQSLNDVEVDVTQTGTGFTPIIGVNLTPVEGLNIGVKYELKTKLVLTNDTEIDGSGMFPDEAETSADIPAYLAVGADYKFSNKLSASVSYNQFFDKQADWGGREDLINHGVWELGIGIEYNISDKLLVSAGAIHGETGVMPEYQTDLSYGNSSNTVGFGFKYSINDKIDINLGALNSFYIDNDRVTANYTETYAKTTTSFSLGLDIKLF